MAVRGSILGHHLRGMESRREIVPGGAEKLLAMAEGQHLQGAHAEAAWLYRFFATATGGGYRMKPADAREPEHQALAVLARFPFSPDGLKAYWAANAANLASRDEGAVAAAVASDLEASDRSGWLTPEARPERPPHLVEVDGLLGLLRSRGWIKPNVTAEALFARWGRNLNGPLAADFLAGRVAQETTLWPGTTRPSIDLFDEAMVAWRNSGDEDAARIVSSPRYGLGLGDPSVLAERFPQPTPQAPDPPSRAEAQLLGADRYARFRGPIQ